MTGESFPVVEPTDDDTYRIVREHERANAANARDVLAEVTREELEVIRQDIEWVTRHGVAPYTMPDVETKQRVKSKA